MGLRLIQGSKSSSRRRKVSSSPDITALLTVIRAMPKIEGVDLLQQLSKIIHAVNISKGWYDKPLTDGELIALCHSELSEALEALRRPRGRRSKKIPQFTEVEEELADVAIRVLAHAAYRKWRVPQAIFAKIRYNATRPVRHGNKKF